MNDELNASIELIQRITGATAQTVQRWKNGTSTPPESASRLLRFHVLGDVSALLGQSWEGFYFRDGLLFIGEWRRGMEPTQTTEARVDGCHSSTPGWLLPRFLL